MNHSKNTHEALSSPLGAQIHDKTHDTPIFGPVEFATATSEHPDESGWIELEHHRDGKTTANVGWRDPGHGALVVSAPGLHPTEWESAQAAIPALYGLLDTVERALSAAKRRAQQP